MGRPAVARAAINSEHKEVFEFAADDFVEGVALADPATYYTDIVMPAAMNLVF